MHKRMGAQGRGSGGTAVGKRRGRFALPAFAACLVAMAFAAPAQATFHEMSIREVYPGGANNASYVELQMWEAGQNFVGTHHLVAYNADGSVNDNFAFASSVANGANQSTILVADSEYSVHFDERPLPDETDPGLNISPAGGAVCWIEGSPPDCVSWGDFEGPLPAHVPALKVGNPVSPSGVTAGKALQRSIAKGCATLLDPAFDDSDDSATDFSEVTPNSRDNATTPVEHTCPPVPNTAIDTKPANPTKATAASFSYHAIPATEASFECRLDGAEFAGCPNGGIEYPGPLAETSHTFQVRAVNPTGTDATPASYTWTVDSSEEEEEEEEPGPEEEIELPMLRPPDLILPSIPLLPDAPTAPQTKLVKGIKTTHDRTPTFRFRSSSAGTHFQCKLDGGPYKPCRSPYTTPTVPFGHHVLKVRAVQAGVPDPTPAVSRFTVTRR